MSSVKACEKHAHRKPKDSYGRLIRVGLVGPKPEAKAVGDGQRVIIPVPSHLRLGGTRGEGSSVPIGHGAFSR